MITLGSKVKDPISGFTGIATGRAEYRYGCIQVLVEPEAMHDGIPVKGHWFDENRLEMIEVRGEAPTNEAESPGTGGPDRGAPNTVHSA